MQLHFPGHYAGKQNYEHTVKWTLLCEVFHAEIESRQQMRVTEGVSGSPSCHETQMTESVTLRFVCLV